MSTTVFGVQKLYPNLCFFLVMSACRFTKSKEKIQFVYKTFKTTDTVIIIQNSNNDSPSFPSPVTGYNVIQNIFLPIDRLLSNILHGKKLNTFLFCVCTKDFFFVHVHGYTSR